MPNQGFDKSWYSNTGSGKIRKKKNPKNYGCLVSWQTEQKFPNTVSQMVNDTDRKMFKVLASILKLSDWYFKTIVGTPGSKV